MGIRWDAVIRGNEFWSESVRPPPAAPMPEARRPVCVQVWLFGSLNDGLVRNPMTVEFRGPFTVGDVIAEIGHVHGRAFLDRVTDSAGILFRNCRVFVNGQAVDDATVPVQTGGQQAALELILLTAAEGG